MVHSKRFGKGIGPWSWWWRKIQVNRVSGSNGGKEVKSEKLSESVEVKTEPSNASSTASTTAKVERPPPRNEPHVEPVNGVVHPPVVPPASRPGRVTNQLMYLKNNVVKGKSRTPDFNVSKKAELANI